MTEETKKKPKNIKYYKGQIRLSIKLASYGFMTMLIAILLICIGLDKEMPLTTNFATSTFIVSTIYALCYCGTAIYEYTRIKKLEKEQSKKEEN